MRSRTPTSVHRITRQLLDRFHRRDSVAIFYARGRIGQIPKTEAVKNARRREAEGNSGIKEIITRRLAQLFADNGRTPKPLPLAKNGNGNAPKFRPSALKGLERLHASFARMSDRDIAIVVGIASKFAQRR